MLFEVLGIYNGLSSNWVLILVLLEYALWVTSPVCLPEKIVSLNPCFTGICSLRSKTASYRPLNEVLILVLLEYALWVCLENRHKGWSTMVLILVLLEYALWADHGFVKRSSRQSLNPCFTGICSLRHLKFLKGEFVCGLNPCFTGICSLSVFGQSPQVLLKQS